MRAPAGDELGYFSTLGRAVSQSWSALGRTQTSLADAAVRSLHSVEAPAGLGATAILGGACRRDTLPHQSKAADVFGQPPLVLYREDDFLIQALTWLDGTTAVHQHGFTGAFMVLEGMSLHVEQSFALAERIAGDRLVVGDLAPLAPEVLRPLDARRIDPGDDFIHALFHLDRPTVTVVVRNESCRLPLPQYSYLGPGLGWDGMWEDRAWSKRVQSIDSLLRLDPGAGRSAVRDLIGSRPVWEAFLLVVHWCREQRWDDFAASLVEVLLDRAEPLRPVLVPALEQAAYTRRILSRRGLLARTHQRVLLALLANLPDAPSVSAVVSDIFPGRPPGTLLLEWLEELAAPDLRGVSGISVPPGRLAELRSAPVDGREGDLLAEMSAAWAGPSMPAAAFGTSAGRG